MTLFFCIALIALVSFLLGYLFCRLEFRDAWRMLKDERKDIQRKREELAEYAHHVQTIVLLRRVK